MSDDEHEAEHALVMPFLPVRSKGGPHDDAAYVAGYEMGTLNAELERGANGSRPIHAENAEQADLIAMRHGWRARTTPQGYGWVWLELERSRG